MKSSNRNRFIFVLVVFILLMVQSILLAIEKITYVCIYTSEKIVIDGNLDEPIWQKAKILDFYIPVTFETPLSKTEGRLLWDENFLYVSFKAYDKDIVGKLTERDSSTYKDDALETFIKPDVQNDAYYNFEINVLGTVYDGLNRKDLDNKEVGKWNCEDLKIGIKIDGTLNNSSDEDKYWQLEVAIPYAKLPILNGKSPESGDNWVFHLGRYDWSVYLPKGKELSSCAPLTKVNFHNYDDWIQLQFMK